MHLTKATLLIQPATIAEAAILTELSVTTMRDTFGPPYNPANLVEEYIAQSLTEPRLTEELADPRSFFFLARLADGTPIGYVKLRRHAPPRRMLVRNAIEIQRIYLLQNQIGQGQGRQLMDFCLNWARSEGAQAVWLGVWERNERALAFYKKMGFERFGYHYFQFGSERQRDFWLQKQLSV